MHVYDHDPRRGAYGLEASDALGVAPERVFKTLVAEVELSGHRDHADRQRPVDLGDERLEHPFRRDTQRVAGLQPVGTVPVSYTHLTLPTTPYV